ncbi:MAG: segregation/condensation protein A [Bdellovibrionales bacterium]|nr:segregation/condensation protein A [Bdellovibrionales bacterium]
MESGEDIVDNAEATVSSAAVFQEQPLLEQPFTVQLDHFLGPIDLLLHLVKKNELEIEKVSLAYVADQYVECLEKMRELDLEIAGEFLVIAATLLSIKSSVLLSEPVELEMDEEGNLMDPHEELLMRLREAAIYKEGAELLSSRPFLGLDVFAPSGSLSKVPSPPETYRDHDPYLLGVAFRKLLLKADSEELRYEIVLESVSIVDRMMNVLDHLKRHPEGLSFEALVGKERSRGMIVGTFIALLELCKRQVLLVRQVESEIVVGLKENEEISTDGLNSEFDEVASGEGFIEGQASPEFVQNMQ